MDGETIALVISLLSSLGTAGFFIIKWILKDRTETTAYERGQALTKGEWLEREKQRDGEIASLRKEISDQRDRYEKRLEDKNVLMEAQEGRHNSEKEALNTEIQSLRAEVSELRHTVRNLQAASQVAKDVKTMEVEDVKTELHTAVDEKVDKLKP